MEAIYIYDGEYNIGEEGYPMIKSAAARHCLELSRPFDFEKTNIIRDEKGKPYFENFSLEFSLTHSGALWMCMFSDQPCGLDLQIIRDCDYKGIAARYFHPDEIQYVEEEGEEGFFHIWVRKEAYCKMTGDGLFGAEMPSVLEDSGSYNGRNYHFTELEISDEMKCAICTPAEIQPELRVLA